MARERFHTTLESHARIELEKIKIEKRFKGANDSIEYLIELYKTGELKDECNCKKQTNK